MHETLLKPPTLMPLLTAAILQASSNTYSFIKGIVRYVRILDQRNGGHDLVMAACSLFMCSNVCVCLQKAIEF